MKLKIDSDIIVYINRHYLKNINLEKKEELKKIIKIINQKYNLDLKGFLEIIMYQDKNYGIVLKIKTEELEYFDCFELEIETNIKIIKTTFLYKIDDYAILDNLNFYKMIIYKDNIYLELKNPSNIEIGKIIENSKIIYDDNKEKIIKRGKIVKTEVITCKQLP